MRNGALMSLFVVPICKSMGIRSNSSLYAFSWPPRFFAVIETDENNNKYETKEKYSIYINGELYSETKLSVNYIDGLKPDTFYKIEVTDGKESRFAVIR